MTTDEDDFWDAAPAKPKYGLTDNEQYYKFPPPPGVEIPKGWRGWKRMTNLVAAFSDQKKLQDWLEWRAFMGLRAADGLLFDEWMAEPAESLTEADQRSLALTYAERARQAAHADAAARRGTARHAMMDTYLTAGRRTGTRAMRMQLDDALEALEAAGLDVLESEFKLWHPACGGTMGTSDVRVLCRRTGQVGIFDWKTQARFWTFQEIAGQLFGYHSAPWKWQGPQNDAGGWVPNEASTLLGHPDGEYPGRRVALVAHMPQHPGPGQLPVEIYEVDLEYGRDVFNCAVENTRLRSIGKSTAVGRRPGSRHPSALARAAIAG